MIKINENNKKILLNKYKIDVDKFDEINDLLDELNDIMVSYVDENDEPLPEFLELEKIYDEIYDIFKEDAE